MKAIINGIEVIGTPREIFEYKQLETRAQAEALEVLTKDFNLQIGISAEEAIENIMNAKTWSLI